MKLKTKSEKEIRISQLNSRLRYFQKQAIKEPNLMDWGACIEETRELIALEIASI